MRRTTPAPAHAALAAVYLHGHFSHISAAGERRPVRAVGDMEIIDIVKIGTDADGAGLLTCIEVHKSRHFSRGEHLMHTVFKCAYGSHGLVSPQ